MADASAYDRKFMQKIWKKLSDFCDETEMWQGKVDDRFLFPQSSSHKLLIYDYYRDPKMTGRNLANYKALV